MCNVPNGGHFDAAVNAAANRIRMQMLNQPSPRVDHSSLTYTVSRDANGQLYYSTLTPFNPNYF